jgi:hypothetical protein
MMDVKDTLDMKTYMQGLLALFPDIRPYDMDDWDWTWADEGYQFLEACDFGMAELTFQRLIAARPRDPDGFEGLAMVYQALGIRKQACVLIDEARRLAELRVAEDALDREVLDDIVEAQRRIHAMPEQAAAESMEDEASDDSGDDE